LFRDNLEVAWILEEAGNVTYALEWMTARRGGELEELRKRAGVCGICTAKDQIAGHTVPPSP
jgi:hypothetical protein